MLKNTRKKSKKTKKHEFCIYIVKILDWNVSYSLTLDAERRIAPGPYWEHVCLEIVGEFIQPDTLINRTINVIILGDRDKQQVMENPYDIDWTPKAIGGFDVSKRESSYL